MTTPDLSSLISSRICHDIISPLGAIGNGVELLAMSGAAQTDEMTLISDSVGSANAKVRFFRLAFGAASDSQSVAPTEISSLLAELSRDGRLKYDWQVQDTASRAEVKRALLAALCIESALPLGGTITLRRLGQIWVATAQNVRVAIDPALWGPLCDGQTPDVSSKTVHFALLAREAGKNACETSLAHGEDWVELRF